MADFKSIFYGLIQKQRLKPNLKVRDFFLGVKRSSDALRHNIIDYKIKSYLNNYEVCAIGEVALDPINIRAIEFPIACFDTNEMAQLFIDYLKENNKHYGSAR